MEDYLNFDQILEQVENDLMTPIEPLSEPAQYDGVIVPPDVIQKLKDKPPYIDEMMAKIEEMDEYAQNRGSMGLDFGIQSLNQAFNGLNPGLTLLAGSANSGKSMMLLEIMRRVIINNQYQDVDHPKKAYCMYFSLDDSNNELMPRLIASDQKIRINDALFPKTLVNKPVVQEKRRVGVENLKANAKYFSMHDALEGQSIQQIERTLSKRYQELEMIAPGEYQIVVFIDNFHDLSYETEGFMEDNQKFDFISGRLNELAIEYNVPVLCSAEFRKISTLKRPTEDDIKSTVFCRRVAVMQR